MLPVVGGAGSTSKITPQQGYGTPIRKEVKKLLLAGIRFHCGEAHDGSAVSARQCCLGGEQSVNEAWLNNTCRKCYIRELRCIDPLLYQGS